MRQRLDLDINHAYEILGLKPGASQVEIKRAYRQLVKTHHPDRFVNLQQKEQAEVKIKQINAAYNLLKSENPTISNSTTVTTSKKSPKTSVNRFDAESFYNYGVESVGKGEYEEAIAYFTQAIRLNPRYVEAYKYRGLVCSQLGYEHRAASDLNKAAQLEGKIPKASAYGRVQYQSQRASWLTRWCRKIKRLLGWR
ncbi:DnaJ domain-containing protein [Aliinostoc sp. HNIBRCY26]|uniref:DnaJ domain-containing protein n=1 Tax=Aliinostoc sp. HNIBRCY26 TaxID=3418997 RepID=UPI003D072A3C